MNVEPAVVCFILLKSRVGLAVGIYLALQVDIIARLNPV